MGLLYFMNIVDMLTIITDPDHPPDCLHRLLLLVWWILYKALCLWVLEDKSDRPNFASLYSRF